MTKRMASVLAAFTLALAVIAQASGPANADELPFRVIPETASGPVGRDHTVVAIPAIQTMILAIQLDFEFHFEVISGPNTGVSSDLGGCVPADCTGGITTNDQVLPVSWSYRGLRPGTDTIRVCADIGELTIGAANEPENGRLRECTLVTMTWVDGGYPLGGNIADQARENRERVAAAQPAPSVAAPRTGTGAVTPPSTGDASLVGGGSDRGAALAVLVAALALTSLATWRLARR